MYKVMMSAGEASGDMHGASVAAALKQAAPESALFGMGGAAMRGAGVRIDYDIAEYGVMGFTEVVKNLPKLFQLRDDLVELMRREKPDVLVVIDYPEFNMRLAKCAKKLGVPVFSYIPPSAWAWRRGRAKSVAKLVDRIAAIFPFEADVYRQAGANVEFVGHPLLDIVAPAMRRADAYAYFQAEEGSPVVLLLPGSRKQEIERLAPVMLESAEKISAKHADVQFFLPVASTISGEILQSILKKYTARVRLTNRHTYDLMQIADAAVAASGTVTLEAALMGVPSVVIYKMSALSYWIGRRLIQIPDISLPNIVAGRRIIPELLQEEVNSDRICAEISKLIEPGAYADGVRRDLAAMRQKLGASGAVERVARLILETAEQGARR